MHWDTGLARDAAGALQAWRQSVDWTCRKLAIGHYLKASVAWVLREWHELLEFMIDRQRRLRRLHEFRLAARDPRLRRRRCHVFGQKCSSRMRPRPLQPAQPPPNFLTQSDASSDARETAVDRFLRDSVHYSSVLDLYSE
jgi:hypothetical protein